MNRVRGIGSLPISLMTVAMVNEAARIQAIANKKIPFEDPRILRGHSNFDPQLFSEVDQERIRLINQWTKDDPKFNERMTRAGLEGANIIIDANEAQSAEGVQATMAAMLIGLWTAFESLAQDTWIAVVNARPKPLADRVLKTLDKEEQQKFLPGKMLSDAGYDLRNCMGDILLRKRAVDFQQLKTIRAAYNVAFAGEFESIFEAYAVELSWLEAERNLFVHKGGLVDQKFIQRFGNQPGMREKIGHSLAVNGEHIAHKANVVSRCSIQLIQAVDKWLDENPETAPVEA